MTDIADITSGHNHPLASASPSTAFAGCIEPSEIHHDAEPGRGSRAADFALLNPPHAHAGGAIVGWIEPSEIHHDAEPGRGSRAADFALLNPPHAHAGSAIVGWIERSEIHQPQHETSQPESPP